MFQTPPPKITSKLQQPSPLADQNKKDTMGEDSKHPRPFHISLLPYADRKRVEELENEINVIKQNPSTEEEKDLDNIEKIYKNIDKIFMEHNAKLEAAKDRKIKNESNEPLSFKDWMNALPEK